MRGVQCKRCFFFMPEWCPKKRDSLDPDLIRDCEFFKTKTNADRIRAMSDDELSRFLAEGCEIAGLECRVARDPLFPADEHLEDCAECWLAWLRKEADNG